MRPGRTNRRHPARWAIALLAGGILATTTAAGTAGAALLPPLPLPGVTSPLTATVQGLTSGLPVVAPLVKGLFDEFTPIGTPVWLGDVKAAIGADVANRSGASGAGVDVALIDTGAVPVAGLSGGDAVANGADLSFDRQSGIDPGLDGYGHGTHLSGIIAGRGTAQTAGVAPQSRLVNVKVGAANGAVDVSQVIAAIDWTVQHRNDPGFHIRVINLSYGTDGTQSYRSDPLAHAVEAAWRNGIVVVVAAGNTGTTLTNPAVDPYVITVGSVDLGNPASALDDRVAAYSSVGTAARRVDLVAPGTSIVSLRDPGSAVDQAHPDARVGTDWFRGSGTSQAAAVTSGAVADLLSARPNLTPDQVKAVLKGSSRLLANSPATAQGAGMINVAAALATVPLASAQSFPTGDGYGSLEAARGTSHVTLDGTDLRGEVDVQGATWKPLIWAPMSWAGTTWVGGYWNGNRWAGDGWATGDDNWTGRTWKGDTWTGRTWKGDAWTGRTWKGDTWTGRTWKSS